MSVNKNQKILEWVNTNPMLANPMTFQFLAENQGSSSVQPIAAEAVIKKYVDGTALKSYDFMLQVMFMISESVGDTTNTDNMFTMQQWQEWIDEQEKEGNYPDFGIGFGRYELLNLGNMPTMALQYENGMALYQFPARLIYLEV